MSSKLSSGSHLHLHPSGANLLWRGAVQCQTTPALVWPPTTARRRSSLYPTPHPGGASPRLAGDTGVRPGLWGAGGSFPTSGTAASQLHTLISRLGHGAGESYWGKGQFHSPVPFLLEEETVSQLPAARDDGKQFAPGQLSTQ